MNMLISCHLRALKTLCEWFDHEHTIFWQSQNSFGYFTWNISVLPFSLELSTLIWCGWDQCLDYCLVVQGQNLHYMLIDRDTQLRLAKIKRMSPLTWRLWEDMLCLLRLNMCTTITHRRKQNNTWKWPMNYHILKNTLHLTRSVMLHTSLVKDRYTDQGKAAHTFL